MCVENKLNREKELRGRSKGPRKMQRESNNHEKTETNYDNAFLN